MANKKNPNVYQSPLYLVLVHPEHFVSYVSNDQDESIPDHFNRLAKRCLGFPGKILHLQHPADSKTHEHARRWIDEVRNNCTMLTVEGESLYSNQFSFYSHFLFVKKATFVWAGGDLFTTISKHFEHLTDKYFPDASHILDKDNFYCEIEEQSDDPDRQSELFFEHLEKTPKLLRNAAELGANNAVSNLLKERNEKHSL